jgi:hypothetical protein
MLFKNFCQSVSLSMHTFDLSLIHTLFSSQFSKQIARYEEHGKARVCACFLFNYCFCVPTHDNLLRVFSLMSRCFRHVSIYVPNVSMHTQCFHVYTVFLFVIFLFLCLCACILSDIELRLTQVRREAKNDQLVDSRARKVSIVYCAYRFGFLHCKRCSGPGASSTFWRESVRAPALNSSKRVDIKKTHR